jgi:hypothetical protein
MHHDRRTLVLWFWQVLMIAHECDVHPACRIHRIVRSSGAARKPRVASARCGEVLLRQLREPAVAFDDQGAPSGDERRHGRRTATREGVQDAAASRHESSQQVSQELHRLGGGVRADIA